MPAKHFLSLNYRALQSTSRKTIKLEPVYTTTEPVTPYLSQWTDWKRNSWYRLQQDIRISCIKAAKKRFIFVLVLKYGKQIKHIKPNSSVPDKRRVSGQKTRWQLLPDPTLTRKKIILFSLAMNFLFQKAFWGIEYQTFSYSRNQSFICLPNSHPPPTHSLSFKCCSCS